MNENDADEISVDEQSIFYYVECPFCSMEFAVWAYLKDAGILENIQISSEVTGEDIVKIYCPRCGEQFPLVIAKAPEVFLQPSPLEQRITKSGRIAEQHNFIFRCLKCNKTYEANVPHCPQCDSTEQQEVIVALEKKE